MTDDLSAIRGETFGNQVKRTRVPRSSGKKVKEVWCHMHGSSHICVDIHISNLTYAPFRYVSRTLRIWCALAARSTASWRTLKLQPFRVHQANEKLVREPAGAKEKSDGVIQGQRPYTPSCPRMHEERTDDPF